jgi:flagellar biogenesis protein FliO
MVNAIATENIVIGTLAGLGVIVLIVMVVFVVKRIMRQE